MSEDQSKTVPDYLRPWFPSEEDFNARFDGLIDARNAWLHFQPLWTSLGYSICYGKVDEECKLRKPLVNQDEVGDPFHPTPTGPFVHSLSDNIENSMFKIRDRGWLLDNPRVTLAYDKLNRLVIIKALDLSETRTTSELDIISYLNSPPLRSSPDNNTIPVLKQAEAEGWRFLIMPAWNMNCAPFFMWQVDDYFAKVIQSLRGLTFMHKHGVAHRDISMSNLVFNHDGTLFVPPLTVQPVISTWDARLAFIDFGISKRYSLEDDPDTWVSSDCEGTEAYMAPEVIALEFSPASYQVLPADIYALGRVWYEWIGWEKTFMRIIREKPQKQTIEVPVYAIEVLEHYIPQFGQLLEEMLNEHPSRRPTAANALQRFEAMRDKIPTHIRFAPAGGYPEGFI